MSLFSFLRSCIQIHSTILSVPHKAHEYEWYPAEAFNPHFRKHTDVCQYRTDAASCSILNTHMKLTAISGFRRDAD
jgi:hypothetical protein